MFTLREIDPLFRYGFQASMIEFAYAVPAYTQRDYHVRQDFKAPHCTMSFLITITDSTFVCITSLYLVQQNISQLL